MPGRLPRKARLSQDGKDTEGHWRDYLEMERHRQRQGTGRGACRSCVRNGRQAAWPEPELSRRKGEKGWAAGAGSELRARGRLSLRGLQVPWGRS